MGVKTSRQILIAGAGRVGRRTAAQLTEDGYIVTIIDRNPDKRETIPNYPINRVIVGDATDLEVFQDANPATADFIAGLTGETETNLAVCELANELAPNARTLLRIKKDGQQDYAYLNHVDHIVYPAAAGASVATSQISGSGETKVSTRVHR
jgi:trk system potassium uptake protein TrkA